MKRRVFFKILASALGFSALSAIPTLVDKNSIRHNKKTSIDISAINRPVNFIGNFIITKKLNNLNVFSARCPHLGCNINNYKDNIIICPCHGSHFDLEGNVLRGPATKPLKKFVYLIESDKIIISE